MMPLANSLLTPADLGTDEPRYPLEVVFCRGCGLVQITETVPPEELFRDYLYFSSYSETMLAHAAALVEEVVQEHRLSGRSLAIEIASNDGYLLQHYARLGVPVLGVEPALNIAEMARQQRGIPTIASFFSADLARSLRAEGKQADVLHAHNVLAHVANLNDVVEGLQVILAPEGVAVIEVPYVRDMVERCEFDTIYHEHLCYFSLTALDRLFGRHGLQVRDVKRVPIHGGSLRIFVEHQTHPGTPRTRVTDLLTEEAELGLNQDDYYGRFAASARKVRDDLRRLLVDLKAQGYRLAAYGAAAKGSTLLNYAGIGTDLLDFVVDRSPYKQGRYMPGVRLPILPPDQLARRRPDYAVLLAWNFADEILEQQTDYRAAGGKFIVPVPIPTVR
jgi:SAM-dependent methyltransferase